MMLHISIANVVLVLVALARPLTADGRDEKKSKYYADLGKYGTFQLEISADDGTMTWTSDLKHIDDLADELQIEKGISLLNYHLYQSWTLDTDYATGEDDCGLKNVGNHYDPYFACGPASGNSDKICKAIGRERSSDRYACTGSYELGLYNECEVGDLSGKYGPLVVEPDGTAYAFTERPDPLAALDTEFVAERTLNPANKWSSIVFHNGLDRVLCAKLFLGTMPDSSDEAKAGDAPMEAGGSGKESGADAGETRKEGDGAETSTNIGGTGKESDAGGTRKEGDGAETSTNVGGTGKESDADAGGTRKDGDGAETSTNIGGTGKESDVNDGETRKGGDVDETPTIVNDPETSTHADDTEEEAEDKETSTLADGPGDESGRRLRRKA